jgi:SHS2 domain-containing protein
MPTPTTYGQSPQKNSSISYAYFDHDADIGIIGRGESIEAAFVSAAEAMFAIMVNLPAVQPEQTTDIAFEEQDIEFAFVTWLNLLLAEARERALIFSRFTLKHDGNKWLGQAQGSPWHAGLEKGVEVKGATLTMLSVKQVNGQWEAGCIVDV